jgi:hypothetical protein
VTRGQAAKILATSLNLDVNKVRNPHFRDVPLTHGFYKYVASFHDAGIIDGYSNGTFGVDDPLTFLNNSTLSVSGTKGTYTSIAGDL